MSKKAEKNETAPPLDFQTDFKMLNFNITLKEQEIRDLKQRNALLIERLSKYENENQIFKENFQNFYNNETIINNLKQKIEEESKENAKLKEDLKSQEKTFEDEKTQITKKFENEIQKLKNLIESYNKRIETITATELLCEKQAEQIKFYEIEKEKLLIDNEDKLRHKELKNQIKFSDMKKKMMEHIKDTQKNVTQLNIEYMDVSTKLTLLQNHQLLIELEYQSQQIEELMKKKESLEKKVFELQHDLQIHKEVEVILAEKNKKLKSINETPKITMNDFEEQSIINTLSVNNNLKDYNVVLSLERKIGELEKLLRKKSLDLEKVKNNFDFLEEKLKVYEKKYSNILNMYEEAFFNLVESEEFKINKQLVLNLDLIKNTEFDKLDEKTKGTLLVLLIKQLAPLIGREIISNGINLNNVNIFFNNSKKILEDNVFKKVFQTNKSTILYSIRRNLESSLPPIITNSSSNKLKSKSISFQNNFK